MLRRILDSPWSYFVLAALLLLGGLLSQVEIGVPTRPQGNVSQLEALRDRKDLNVLFIVIDTLRADALSAYGAPRPTSPLIDSIAASGIRFAHARAQSSWTKSSMASLWLAAYPNRTGILRFDQALAKGVSLPAEALQRAGLETTALVRNPWLDRNFGFARGFDLYLFPTPSPSATARPDGAVPGSDRDVIQSAIEFVTTHEKERFFLYLHLMDVHQYYSGMPTIAFGTTRRDLYDASIRWVDSLLGELFTVFEQKDLTQRTLVVIASDHGEEFFEHGGEGHQRTLYSEVLDVPLIVGLPFRVLPGIVVEEPVENVDIWPTVFDLLGLPPAPGADGRSLVPLIQAAATQPATAQPARDGRPVWTRPSFSMLDLTWGERNRGSHPLVSVTQGTLMLIDALFAPDQVQLFDLASDPGTQHDLAAGNPEGVAALRRTRDEILARPPLDPPVTLELDAMRLEQLRALGYAAPSEAK